MMTNEEWQTFFLEDGWCVTTPNDPTCVEQAPVAALQLTSYTRFWTVGFLWCGRMETPVSSKLPNSGQLSKQVGHNTSTLLHLASDALWSLDDVNTGY
jgi:hypothetical protein